MATWPLLAEQIGTRKQTQEEELQDMILKAQVAEKAKRVPAGVQEMTANVQQYAPTAKALGLTIGGDVDDINKNSETYATYNVPGVTQGILDISRSDAWAPVEEQYAATRQELMRPDSAANPFVRAVSQLADLQTGSKLAQNVPQIQTASERAKQVLALEADRNKRLLEVLSASKGTKTLAEQLKEGLQLLPPKDKNKKTSDDVLKETKALAKKLEAFEPLRSGMSELETLVGGFDKWKSGKDIPGIGVFENKAPDFMLKGDAAQIRKVYQGMKDGLLRAKSGAQINEQEFRRLSVILGTSITGGEREFIAAMKSFKRELKDIMAQREAPWRGRMPTVLDAYRAGGGQLSDTISIMPPTEQDSTQSEALKRLEALEKRNAELLKKKEAK